jgi:hypothetical protein
MHKNNTLNNVKTSTKQNFCFQIYYNIIFYYNSQNTQIQVLENRKQKLVTKHTLTFPSSLLYDDCSYHQVKGK